MIKKISVGETYQNGMGDMVTILRKFGNDFYGVIDHSDIAAFNSEGKYLANGVACTTPHPYDLSEAFFLSEVMGC